MASNTCRPMDMPVINGPVLYDDSFARMLELITGEPTPDVIHYDVVGMAYVPPTKYYWKPTQQRPSDCTWIIPGTGF